MSSLEDLKSKFNYEINRDLVYYFDENQIEIIYTRLGTEEKIRQHILVTDLHSDPLKVKQVLSCRLYDEPRLLIICTDSNDKNHFFWHSVISSEYIPIQFETPIIGKVTEAKLTRNAFEVNYVYKTLVTETKMCYALVLGMEEGSSILILLNIDHLTNIHVSFKYLEQEENDDIGHVTSIYILPQDANDRRMGHHDPQILLGYSKGAIRIYRFRATVYSFKAPRVRSPIDLSEFTEFPGYPITHLSCARTYNSLKFIVAFAQEKPENDTKHKDAKSYVKLVEFNGNLRHQLNLFHPSSSTCSVIETQLMPHYEDGVDLTIIYYNKSYIVNVWYLDNKQQLRLKLEKTASEDACIEPLEPAYNTHPDLKAYLLRHPDKIIEFVLPHHAVGLKRKATTDFFKESLEAIELQSKKERLLHRSVGGDQKNIFKDKEELPLSPYDYDEIADIGYADMDEVDMSVMQQKFNAAELPTEENQTDKASNEQLEGISNNNQIQLDSEELNEEDITVTTSGLNDVEAEVEAEVEADLDNRDDTTANIDVVETTASADFAFSITKDNSIGNALNTETPAITAEQSIGDTKEKAGLNQSNLSAEPENSEDSKTKTKESMQGTQKMVDQGTVIKEIDITTEKVEKLEENAAEIDQNEEIKMHTEEIEQAAIVEQETIAEPFVLIETASVHDKQEYVEPANEVTVLLNQEEQIDQESENIADVEEKVDQMSENPEDDSSEVLEEYVNPVNMMIESSNEKDIDQMSEYSEDEQKKEPSNEDHPEPSASTAAPDQSDVDAQDIMSLDRSDTWMEIDPADGNQIEPMDEGDSFVILDTNEGSPDDDMLSLSDKQDEENEYADVIEAEIEENDQEYEDEKAHDENEEEEEREGENEAIFEDEEEQTDESSESSINESFIQLPEYQEEEEASEQDEIWKVQENEEEQEQSKKEKESSDVQPVTSQDLDDIESDKAEDEQEQDFKKSVEDDSASLPEYEETNQFYEAQGENKDETSDIYELADDYESEYVSYRDSQGFENNDELEDQQEEQLKEDYDEYLDAEGGYDEIEGEKAHVNENNDLISGQPEILSGTANVYPEYDEEDVDYPYEEDEEEEFPVDYDYDKTDGYDSLSEKDEYEHSEENTEAQSETVEIISDDDIEESDTKDNSAIEVVDVIDSDEDELNSSSDSVKDPEIGHSIIQSFKPAGEIVVQDKAPASALAKLTALYSMDFYRWGRRKC